MKTLFLTGDASIDLLIEYQALDKNKIDRRPAKNLDNNPSATLFKRTGGVLLLKEFLTQLIKNNALITFQEVKWNTLESLVNIQTIASVRHFDDKKPDVLHVDQFLGYSSRNETLERVQLQMTGTPVEADLVIIDDAGNGFRNSDAQWLTSLAKNNKDFSIIHKINWPLNDNPLLKAIGKSYGSRAIAIVNADDLREQGLSISRQVSWDKTIDDFLHEFPTSTLVKELRDYDTVIVRFGLEAVILLFKNKDIPATLKESEMYDSFLFYIPGLFEGQTVAESKKNMQGLTQAFVASLVSGLTSPSTDSELLNKSDSILKIPSEEARKRMPLKTSIIPAMRASLACLNSGYLVNRIKHVASYPIGEIFSSEFQKNTESNSKRPRIVFIGLSGYLKRNKKQPEKQKQGDQKMSGSLIGHITLNSPGLLHTVAMQYVLTRKKSLVLEKVPVLEVESLMTYDREEIENYSSFVKLVAEHLSNPVRIPLSVAVFGPPGSGKSFGIKQITASSRMKEQITLIESNLSQFQSFLDLVPLFQEARDISLRGKVPLLFFDEFDTSYSGQALGWLQYFLAPMQDGLFKDGEKMHPIGKSIFIFAGATKKSFDEFVSLLKVSQPDENTIKEKGTGLSKNAESSGLKQEQVKALKLPDFISRLKGVINIKGIDQVSKETDNLYFLRRALVLRSLLERNYKNLTGKGDHIHIENDLLEALLTIPQYRYGARSLESIIRMSDLSGERTFKKSNLPSEALMNLHIDFKTFNNMIYNSTVFPTELIETIAREIHYRWLANETANKSQKTTAVEWDKTNEDTKNSNRGQALDILRKLKVFGYDVVSAKNAGKPVLKFPEEEEMAKMEHDRWNEEKINNGWTYGKLRNDRLKIHDCLLPWDDLPESVKDYDRAAVKAIPELLKGVGYGVVKEPK